MINIALIEKILKVSGETEDNIVRIMDELGRTLNEKFAKSFIVYVEEHVKDDDEIEKLVSFVEQADQITPEKMQEYVKWTEKNSDVDFDDFWEKFEEETQTLEKKIIDNVKDKLTDAQKKEIIDFIQNQSEELKKADEEYIQLLEEVQNAAKKQVQDEIENVGESDTKEEEDDDDDDEDEAEEDNAVDYGNQNDDAVAKKDVDAPFNQPVDQPMDQPMAKQEDYQLEQPMQSSPMSMPSAPTTPTFSMPQSGGIVDITSSAREADVDQNQPVAQNAAPNMAAPASSEETNAAGDDGSTSDDDVKVIF